MEHSVIEAVPGAGKTHRLLQLAEEEPQSLILTYNNQLASDTREVLGKKGSHATCLTFHSLCIQCLGEAYDDEQMLSLVEAAERGALAPKLRLPVKLLLLDEAQDMRALYVRLLRIVGLVSETIRIVVVGDRNQLIYTFDASFPVDSDVLLRPEHVFGGQWTRLHMNDSRRMPTNVTLFVCDMFQVSIGTTRTEEGEVRVLAPTSWLHLYDHLRNYLHPGAFVLVDRKKNNQVLKTLINTATRKGKRFFVHGVDSGENDQSRYIQCGTFWSAKGLECDTAIVLLPEGTERNPTFVATTRARRRLILVLDPRRPHPAACRAILGGLDERRVVLEGGNKAYRTIVQGAASEVDWKAGGVTYTSSLQHLDEVSPARDSFSTEVVVPGDPADELLCTLPLQGRIRDFSSVLLRMALVDWEWRSTGRVRRMEEILQPTRTDRTLLNELIPCGFVGHIVTAPDDSLLADDLRAIARQAYEGESEEGWPTRVAVVALATLAWDGFDHVMRSLLPCDDWKTLQESLLRRSSALLPTNPFGSFDTRLRTRTTTCRVDGMCDAHSCMVVWCASGSDLGRAAQRARLHPSGRCHVTELLHGRVVRVSVP